MEPSQRYAVSKGRRSRVQSPDPDGEHAHARRNKARDGSPPLPTGGRTGETQQSEGAGVPFLDGAQGSPERDPTDDYWLPPWEQYSGWTLATAAAAISSTPAGPADLSRTWTRWLRLHGRRLWRRELVALVRAALQEKDLSRAMTMWQQTSVQSLRHERSVLKSVLLDADDSPDPSLERGGPMMRSPSRLPQSLSQQALSQRSHLAPLQLDKRFPQHQTSPLPSTNLHESKFIQTRLALPPSGSLTHYMQAGAQAEVHEAGAHAVAQATPSPHRVMHRVEEAA